ncbi:unnamed protein product, partial [Prorocentrum cordatum]
VEEGEIGEKDTKTDLKLLLRTTFKTRLTCSINRYTMSNEHPVSIATTQELRKSGTPEDKKRLQEIGSPAPSLAMAALEGLHKCDVGGSMKGAIQNHLLRAEPEDIEAEAEICKEDPLVVVPFVRLEKRYDDTKTKLAIGAPTWEGRVLISRTLEAEGQAVHHRGAAPAGWLEEEVGHWLETLEQ